MKIVGCNEFVYNEVGKGVMFMSMIWYESLSADDGTVKVALFYGDNKEVRTNVAA